MPPSPGSRQTDLMTVQHLPAAASAVDPPTFAGPDHPMRKVTRQVAFADGWDAERARKVTALFDGMAGDWTADHESPERLASLVDALDRGDVPAGLTLELGSGTGLGTRILRDRRGGCIVALDIAGEMLANAPAEYGARVRADAAALPVATSAVSCVVLVNALLFPTEVDRVLGPGGAVVWVNTLGDQTPIHLPVDDVIEALPGPWRATASRAGTGSWAVVTRIGDPEVPGVR